MRLKRLASLMALASAALLMGGCAAPKHYDYSAFRESKPKSILVLPPVNNSPAVEASYSFLSWATYPLAESGYYVMPVTLVDETFRQNGLANPAEMHAVAPAKLADIFGADAAMYITISDYGAKYMLLDSAVVVTASAKLVDLKTSQTLWEGQATASTNENNNNSGGGLAGALVAALVKQVLNNVLDQSHTVANMTSQRLLTAGRYNGMLYGPRSPMYGKEQP